MLHDAIDRLNGALAHPAVYREADQTIHLHADLVRHIVNALVWAGDEIAQLSEDLHGATGAVAMLTEELKDAEDEIDYLHGQVADELIAEQRLDYYRAV